MKKTLRKTLQVLLTVFVCFNSTVYCIYADENEAVEETKTEEVVNTVEEQPAEVVEETVVEEIKEEVETETLTEQTETEKVTVEEEKATEQDATEKVESETEAEVTEEKLSETEATETGSEISTETEETTTVEKEVVAEETKEETVNEDVLPLYQPLGSALGAGSPLTATYRTISFNGNKHNISVDNIRTTGSFTYPSCDDDKTENGKITITFVVDGVTTKTEELKIYDVYKFLGWDSNSGSKTAGHAAGSSGYASSNKTYYAIWGNKTTEYDALTTPGATKDKWTFLNWNTKEDGSGVAFAANTDFDPAKNEVLQSDCTLYGQFEKNVLNVTFNANGHGTAPSKIDDLEAGDKVTLPGMEQVLEVVSGEDVKFTYWDGATKTGTIVIPETTYHKNQKWILLGWSTNNKAKTPTWTAGQEIEVNAKITLYAVWKNDGTAYDEFTAPDYAKDGYTLTGWYKSSGLTGKFIENGKSYDLATLVEGTGAPMEKTEDLHGKWVANEYTITYVLDGGTNSKLNPSKYTIETNTIVLRDATKTDYVFDGWYLEDTFVTQVETIAKGSFGDKTLYAKWTPAPKAISKTENGATVNIGLSAQTPGQTVTFTVSPSVFTKFVSSVSVVDSDGATVEVSEDDGTYSFTMPMKPVTIIVNGTDYTIGLGNDKVSLTIESDKAGETAKINSNVNNENVEVVWTSSDESVVVVDNDGNVTAVGKGTATVTAAIKLFDGSKDDFSVYATATVKVVSKEQHAEVDEETWVIVEDVDANKVEEAEQTTSETIDEVTDPEVYGIYKILESLDEEEKENIILVNAEVYRQAIIGGEKQDIENIHELAEGVKVTVYIPADKAINVATGYTRVFKVYYYHFNQYNPDGTPILSSGQLMSTDAQLSKDANGKYIIDADGRFQLEFIANKFSTYSVTFKDVKKPTPPVTPSSEPSSEPKTKTFIIPNTGVDSVIMNGSSSGINGLVLSAGSIIASMLMVINNAKAKTKAKVKAKAKVKTNTKKKKVTKTK